MDVAMQRPAGRCDPVLAQRDAHPISSSGVSMNRIESRPAHTGLWQYAFFIDVGGHIDEAPLRDVVSDLEDFAENVTVLGSYPVAVP